MKILSEKQYLDKGGNHCPVCDTRWIQTTESVELDSHIGWQNVICTNCGAYWTDYWSLTGYGNLHDKEENELEVPNEPNRITV